MVGPRVGEAMERSVRWLDRCILKHESSGKKDTQNLFAIVQGGLDPELRDRCLDEMVKRKDGVAGFAIGGLSGGEEKGDPSLRNSPVTKRATDDALDVFWRMYEGSMSTFRIIRTQPHSASNNVQTSSLKIVRSPIIALTDSFSIRPSGPRYSMGIGFAEGAILRLGYHFGYQLI